jgi:hypothetical protein
LLIMCVEKIVLCFSSVIGCLFLFPMPFRQNNTAKKTHTVTHTKKKTLGGAPWHRDHTATAHTGGSIHSMAVLGLSQTWENALTTCRDECPAASHHCRSGSDQVKQMSKYVYGRGRRACSLKQMKTTCSGRTM